MQALRNLFGKKEEAPAPAPAPAPSLDDKIAILRRQQANLEQQLLNYSNKEEEYTAKATAFKQQGNVEQAMAQLRLRVEVRKQQALTIQRIKEVVDKLTELIDKQTQQLMQSMAPSLQQINRAQSVLNRPLGGRGRRKTRKGKAHRRITRRR